MRCLSLTQPWATLVAIGAKKIETRSWQTRHRGPLAIHASAGFPKEARELCDTEPFRSALAEAGFASWRELPLGAVVAVVEVTGCRSTNVADWDDWPEGLSEREWHFGNYDRARFGWFLDLTERIEPPVPAKGALGLWEWDGQAGSGAKPDPYRATRQLERQLQGKLFDG